MTDKAYHYWLASHAKYQPCDMAESLYRVSTDYRIKYSWREDLQVKRLMNVLLYMREDAKENQSAAEFYEVLYGITKRYKEQKIW